MSSTGGDKANAVVEQPAAEKTFEKKAKTPKEKKAKAPKEKKPKTAKSASHPPYFQVCDGFNLIYSMNFRFYVIMTC